MIITKKILQTSLLPIILLSQMLIADPIHEAVEDGNLNKVMRIIEHSRKWYAIRIDINMPDSLGATPLELAAKFGYADIAQFLIDSGANVNRKDIYHLTPLHIASMYDRVDVVKVLIKNGADVNAVDKNGILPMKLALFYGVRFEIIQLLKIHGSSRIKHNGEDVFKTSEKTTEMEDLSEILTK